MQFYLELVVGVLCVIFGIYEKLLDSILNFFKDVKNNFKFLCPIFIGIGIGVLIFSNILNYFFINFPIQIKSIFIGFILGSIPSLFKECRFKDNFKISYLFYIIVSFFIGIALVILENHFSSNVSFQSFSFLYLILAGFSMSIGIVVPGVSSTIILMIMGVYSTYLSSISTLYFPVLIPIGIGLIIGSFLFMKITNFLLKHFYAKTFSSIIGFSLGSIFVLLPNIFSFPSFVISILCIILGYLLMSFIK